MSEVYNMGVLGWYPGWYGKGHVLISIYYGLGHWFFGHECQHIFGLPTVYICTFSVSLIGLTKWSTKIELLTLHWINSIIRNNKCIFTKLNADLWPVTVVSFKESNDDLFCAYNTYNDSSRDHFHYLRQNIAPTSIK